jgi:hypothetical protein
MHPRSRTVRRALGLVMLAALVVVALAACGGTEKEAKPRPLPEDDKALQPGEYRSEEFEPSLSFRVGDGWTNVPPESSEVLAIQWGFGGEVNFFRLKEVYEPARMGMPNVEEAPKDPKGWVAWGRHHPYLRTSEPEQVEVGGVEGERIDVVVGDLPEDYRGRCGTDCVDIGRVEGVPPLKNDVFVPEDEKARVTFLDVEGETVTISIISPASEFEEFVPEAQKVLDSVEWRGS